MDERRLQNADWLFVEGYVLANPETGQGAVREAVRLAKRHGMRVALTCSEAFIVTHFGEAFFETLGQTDLLFCNASEASAATGATGAEKAFAALAQKVPSAVVTDGANGAYVRHNGIEAHVPAYPCKPVDLTGAGDMLAGAFLYGITHDIAADRAARAACYLAMKVITQVGAACTTAPGVSGTRPWLLRREHSWHVCEPSSRSMWARPSAIAASNCKTPWPAPGQT